jgi:uncharacterized protein (DUF1015 family)
VAEVRPFAAVRYGEAAEGPLEGLVAPPYDVIDDDARRELLARSRHNVVHLTLPDSEDEAARRWSTWLDEGVLRREAEAFWALQQDYVGPDGVARTRTGLVAALRLEPYERGVVLPHERTHREVREGRLRLLRAVRSQVEPIFLLYEGARPFDLPDRAPELEVEGARLWRLAEGAGISEAFADRQLLIADGHHRYETARAYADSIAGDDGHSYTLMNLVSLEDPGLTVFPTHRLLTGLADPSSQQALDSGLERLFEVEEVPAADLEPAGERGIGVFGYVDSHQRRGLRLRLRDTAELDRVLDGRPEAYRRLDAVILEALVLRGILRMTEEDVEAKRGIAYAKGTEEVWAEIESGRADSAFLLRPAPVEEVREVAASGETMPPKSTYFFPKVLTGMVFNPLS